MGKKPKKPTKKLEVKKETLRRLDDQDLGQVAGGLLTGDDPPPGGGGPIPSRNIC